MPVIRKGFGFPAFPPPPPQNRPFYFLVLELHLESFRSPSCVFFFSFFFFVLTTCVYHLFLLLPDPPPHLLNKNSVSMVFREPPPSLLGPCFSPLFPSDSEGLSWRFRWSLGPSPETLFAFMFFFARRFFFSSSSAYHLSPTSPHGEETHLIVFGQHRLPMVAIRFSASSTTSRHHILSPCAQLRISTLGPVVFISPPSEPFPPLNYRRIPPL